jgi:two-component system sensor histidine kinase ChiS
MGVARILIADDNIELLDAYKACLADKYDIVVAEDGLKAWRLIQSQKPDIIVTDVSMPGIDGLTLLEKIRGNDALSEIPVVIITGLTEEYDLPESFWKHHTGAEAFLAKPFDLAKLRAEIERLIARKVSKPGFKRTGYL